MLTSYNAFSQRLNHKLALIEGGLIFQLLFVSFRWLWHACRFFKTTIVRYIGLKGRVAPRAFCRFLAPYIVAQYWLNVANEYGDTPLDEATAFANKETIALLQQAGATHGEGFRIKAAPTATGGHIPANVLNADLHTAAKWGKTETVKLLIERRANIAAKDVAAKCCSSYSFQKYLIPPVL